MGNRLKDIWSGFEQTTSRHLTGRGVENINVPHRTDYAAEDEAFLPEKFSAPAEAAFAALHERLKHHEKRFGGKRRREAAAQIEEPEDMAERKFHGDELVRGLRATAMRTERAENDYAAFAASSVGKAVLKKHKKKRFGIF